MASAKLITELYEETLYNITKNDETWRQFLKTASMNYKRPFQDQVLIYAQRPEAIACLNIETWNNKFNRWVKKYSKGIALLTNENGRSGIEYVFNLNDTQNKYGKNIYLWKVGDHYANDIIESLENTYGTLLDKTNLANAIISTTTNIIEDNLAEYAMEFNSLNEDNLKKILIYSISYMTINRCGFNPDDYITPNDLQNIKIFENYDDILGLGLTTTDISRMELGEIYNTIKKLRQNEINKIYTFDNSKEIEYDDGEKRNFERSEFDGNNLRNDRGLSNTEYNITSEESESIRKIRYSEIGLSEKEQQEALHQIINARQVGDSLGGNSRDSRGEITSDNSRISNQREDQRGIEIERSNEVGRVNERIQNGSRRNDNERVDTSLGNYEKGSKHYPFVVVDSSINQIISKADFKVSKSEIIIYFSKEEDINKRIEYLKNIFNSDYTGVLVNNEMFGYKAFDNGVLFWKGNFLTRDRESLVSWNDLTYHFDSMILLHKLNDYTKNLPTMNEQLSIIEENNISKQNSELEFSQEFIDKYLQERYSEHKYLIYQQFENSLSSDENINFLKDLYGIGGSSHIIKGSGIGEDHDSKGITLYRGYLENRIEKLLKWNYIEKRIKFLIKEDRYLNSKEKENYSAWVSQKDEDKTISIDDINVNEVENLVQYKFNLGDKVYIGADEYEILYLDDEIVRLYDFKYPLFNQEYLREEFERKVKENPANDYLKNNSLEEDLEDDNVIDNEDMYEIINYPNELDDENSYTVARIINNNKCVELHYNQGRAFVEYGTRVSESEWENYIVDIYWFDKETSTEEMTRKLNIYFEKFNNEDIVPNTDEIDLLYDILSKHKIYDIILDIEGDKLVADDSDNRWEGKEFYDFLFNEVFNYNDKGTVDLIDDNKFFKLKDYYNDYLKDEKQEEIPKDEIEISDKELIPNLKTKRNNKINTFDPYPEIKDVDRIQYHILNNDLGVGTSKEKFNRNVEAIKILKKCEEESRFATFEEQEKLAQYVGWGGLSQAFDENNDLWKNEYVILKNILNQDEYEKARESTLTAFYTPPIVINSMYKVLENNGLKTGNILEPSCGIGNFIGMLPDTLSDCKIYGVELDSISGKIARQLYQRSMVAIQKYEDTDLPDSFFDVAIGNIPFGDFKVVDRKYDKNNFLIHDYFFAKTLDKIRTGGVIAFITSKGTLDKTNPNVRKYIARRADLIGAIRLPNNTFKANAGTEITSDIIFLQKKDSITDIEPDWLYLDTLDNGIKINNYFIEHPEMILGKMETIKTQYGYDSACIPYDDRDLSDLLEEAIKNIKIEIKEYNIEDIDEEDLSIPADFNVRNFSYTIVDDKVYFRENSKMYLQELAETTKNRVKGLIELRDSVRKLIEYQSEDYPDEDIKLEQQRLNILYDKFNKKYVLINSRGNSSAFSDDSSYYLLCSLEILDENRNLVRKADMFTKRTIRPKISIKQVDTASEALLVSLSEKARVDLEFMQNLCGIDMEKMLEDLSGKIFKIPDNENDTWITADEYLSGNVREKLRIAEKYAEINDNYLVNVKYLKEVQPKDLSASEISVRLGATWIPSKYIKDFINYLLEPSWMAKEAVKVHFMKSTSEWNIENKSYDRFNVKSYSTYGTSRANAYKIIEETLNLKDVRIFDYHEDENGKRIAVMNKKETAIAQSKQEKIKSAFESWIWSDSERRRDLTQIYNETFNSVRPREYDGSHILFDGINPEITLRPHQVNAIARILYGGNTLLAHEVGAGKTFEMVAAAMESKRLGLCNKSLFVVPNHIVEQFGQEFLQLYPSANVLITTKKDFQTANRKKFCSRIATGDYDAIIISHSQFEKIPVSSERQKAIIQKQINEIMNSLKELKNNNGERFSIKQLEKSKKNLETKLEKLNDNNKKDDVITFEELGVDRIFVDEAHYYKNLFLYTKMRNVGGIAQTEAQKSSDLYMKCRYLDEITGNKGVIFATGTPISNSMVELYTLQRYLQYDELAKRGLQHFDAWASTFGETTTAIELSPEGTGYRSKIRFSKFYNLPELMNLFKEVADIQTSEMLNLPVPKANYHNMVVKPSEIQKELVKDLSERAERIRDKQVPPYIDNMLKITNDGRKLALDQRLSNELLEDYKDSKVAICANNVFEIWDKTSENKSAQLVFCDLSTPHNDGKFNVYDDLKKKLVHKGIPTDEIAFIHDVSGDVKKQELFNKVRKGQVRVLIGSTQKMGAGTNCQDRLIASHDLDCPWRPSDLIQRSGRIIRQGNQNKEVDIYRYVTEGTFDAYLYQLVENKQRFISQIMTSKTPVRFAEDIDETALSYAEIKALAAGNPLIIEKTELDTQVAKLKLLKQTYLSEKYSMEDKIQRQYPNEIKRLEILIENTKNDVEFLESNIKNEVDFQGMKLDGEEYLDKSLAGKKILEICKTKTNTDKSEIGEYKGFKMFLYIDTYNRKFCIDMKNNLSYKVELGSDVFGNIVRIDNVLNGIEKRIDDYINSLEETKKQFENAKLEINIPFQQEEELKKKSKRLNELNIMLNLNEKDKEIMDDVSEDIYACQGYKKEYAR